MFRNENVINILLRTIIEGVNRILFIIIIRCFFYCHQFKEKDNVNTDFFEFVLSTNSLYETYFVLFSFRTSDVVTA